MPSIPWEHYPYVAQWPPARAWLELQAKLGLSLRTLTAYGRSANDFLAFCQSTGSAVEAATRADIAAYVDDMRQRPNPTRGATGRSLSSGVGLAHRTMRLRITVARLLYEYLIDEGIRVDPINPVGKGSYTPGRLFTGKRERAILPHYETVPWIPGDDEWERIVGAAAEEPIRNRLMLLLAYDGALRRSELVALEVRDIAFPHQQVTIRPETAKNGAGRVVMYGDTTRVLLQRYMDQRADAGITGGVLLRSESNRNRSAGITPDAWDKVVARIAQRAGLNHRFTTHTTRHLRLTDLARAGLEINRIAQYAGHRSIETTKLYITLSGRETAEHVRLRLQDLDRRLAHLCEGAS